MVKIDAAKLVLENLLLIKGSLDYTQEDGTTRGSNPCGLFEIFYPDNKFKIYAELGANDHRQNRLICAHILTMQLQVFWLDKGIFGNDVCDLD